MLSTPPQNDIFRDPDTGRVWPPHLLDRFIVGHIHGPYDFRQSCLHLGLADSSFIDMTKEELHHLWNTILIYNPIHPFWARKSSQDAEVKRVLQDIKTLMVDAQLYYEEHHDEFNFSRTPG